MKQYLIIMLAFLVACAPVAQEQVMQKESVMMEKETGQIDDAMGEIQKDESMMEKDAMMDKEGLVVQEPAMDEAISMMSEPKVIAGTVTKYYELDVALLDKSVEEGKIVVLQFFANWCPKCKAQEPELTAAYNELQRDDVVGFRVHYKDDQTTKEHEDFARKYGVASQGTTVILKDGQMVFKSPAHLNKDQFIAEIAKV